MTKFLRSAALMAVMAGGVAGVLTVTNDTVAQEKGTKETPKKGEKTEKGDKDAPKKGTAVKAGVFEISEGKDKMFRFSIRDGEGKFLAGSSANKFATEEECRKGIEHFKAVLKDAKIELKKDEK